MSASRPPVLLVIAAAMFAVFLGLLVAQSLAPRRIETFTLGAHAPRPPTAGRADTVTLDVRDGQRWHYFDLDRGAALEPADSQGWDLAARRFQLRVPAGAATTTPAAPSAGASSPSADPSGNLPRWYRYDFLAHLLRPTGDPYRLRTDAGREVVLEVLGYYCPGPTAGCLTFRYALQARPARAPRLP
jgi:hypothetical protein